MDKDYLIKLDDICKTYEEPGSPSVEVLNAVRLEVKYGSSISIVGPSGSGKTTLLNIIASVVSPSSGEVLYKGEKLSGKDETDMAYFRNREIGFVFQQPLLLPQCNVIENVLIPTLAFPEKTRTDNNAYAAELLDYTGIHDKAGSFPHQLSGGEKVRVGIVRALINNPSLLLADEPTGSLDNETALNISDLFIKLNTERNLTVIIVTHSEVLAEKMHECYQLKNGALIRKR